MAAQASRERVSGDMIPPGVEDIREEAIALVEERQRVERRKIGLLALIMLALLVAVGYVASSARANTVEGVQLVQTLGGLAFLGIVILFTVGAYFYRPLSIRLLVTARLAGIELEIRKVLTATGQGTRKKAMNALRRKCEAMLQATPILPVGKIDFYLESHRDFVKTIIRAIKRLKWLSKRRDVGAITERMLQSLDDLVRKMWANSQHLTDEMNQSAHQFLDSLGGALPSRWSVIGDFVANPSMRSVALIVLLLLFAFGISLAMAMPVAVVLGAPAATALAPAGAMSAAIFAALYVALRRRKTQM